MRVRGDRNISTDLNNMKCINKEIKYKFALNEKLCHTSYKYYERYLILINVCYWNANIDNN